MTSPAAKTETPRTDEAADTGTLRLADGWYANAGNSMEYVPADFARTLEKENAALQRALQTILDNSFNEDNEWDGVERLHANGDTARACLAAISQTEG